VFKEVKECEKMAPVFGKLRQLFFGGNVDVKVVKGYHDKMKCLEDLGQLIPEEEVRRSTGDC
jgi:hypothetical protein